MSFTLKNSCFDPPGYIHDELNEDIDPVGSDPIEVFTRTIELAEPAEFHVSAECAGAGSVSAEDSAFALLLTVNVDGSPVATSGTRAATTLLSGAGVSVAALETALTLKAGTHTITLDVSGDDAALAALLCVSDQQQNCAWTIKRV